MSLDFRTCAAAVLAAATLHTPLPTKATTSGCVDYGAGAQYVDRFVLPGGPTNVSLQVHSVGVDRLVLYTSSGLWSFDITDRSHPAVEQTQGLPFSTPRELAMLGDSWVYAVVSSQDSLVTADFTTPTSPVVTSKIGIPPLPSAQREMVVDGSWAYLGGVAGLTILDLSTPSTPTVAATVALTSDATGVAANGPFAYAATPSGLFVVKVQPTNTAHVIPPVLPVTATDIVVSGSYAYAIDPNAGFTVLDVSTPNAPALVASLPGVTGYRLWATPGAVYTSTPYRRIDVSNPLAPVAGVSISTAFKSDVSVVDDRAYLQETYTNSVVLDMTAFPEPVAPCGTASPGCDVAWTPATFGNHAFAIRAYLGPINEYYLYAYDLTDPSSPLVIPLPSPLVYNVNYHLLGGTNGIARDLSAPASPYVFETTGATLNAWDVSDPTNMKIVAQTATTAGTEDFAVENGLVYCASPSGLQILDVSSPLAPSARGSVNPHAADLVTASGPYAYLLDGASGDYSVVDATDPDFPGWRFRGNLGFAATALDVQGSFLYVMSDTPERLYVLDVSDPTLPSVVGSVAAPFTGLEPSDLEVRGTTVYVTARELGLLAFDVTVPAAPTYAGGIWTTVGAFKAFATDDAVLYSAGCVLAVAPLHCGTTGVGVPQAGAGSGFALGSPTPNPFLDRTSIAFRVAGEGTASVRVYGVSGRLVRVLREGPVPAGPHVASWDGRDERGRPVAAGIYFARLESSSNEVITRKIVRLR